MFEGLKFVFGVMRGVWQGIRQGAPADVAEAQAIQQMMEKHFSSDFGPDALPEGIISLWSDPENTYRDEHEQHEQTNDFWFGHGTFEVTAPHIALLRQMRFVWDCTERGAPMLDPARPYGSALPLGQIIALFAEEDPERLARRHVEMLFVLTRALVHGQLQPGSYSFRNITPEELRASLSNVADDDLGLNSDATVTITDEHIKLLRHITVEWPSQSDCEDRLASGEYPAATCDPKRTYGDYTVIEIDMSRILGRLPPAPSDGRFRPEPELVQHLQRLHWQMLPAMQVFVENARLEPGLYTMERAS